MCDAGAMVEMPEVAEPQLSMEVQDQLKRSLSELEERYLARGEGDAHPAASAPATLAFAASAVAEMVKILRSFDPEASKEALSSSVHGLLYSDAVVGHLDAQSKSALQQHVPVDRKNWLAEDIEGHSLAVQARLHNLRAKITTLACSIHGKGARIAADPGTQVVVLSAGSGAVVLGITGGVLGLCSGGASGALLGAVPAPLTLGLSLPAGAVLGGGLGGCLGAAAGATAGLVGGSAAGSVACRYRAEIRDGVLTIKVKARAAIISTKSRALETTAAVKGTVTEWVGSAKAGAQTVSEQAQARASQLGDSTRAVVSDRAVQATAASAVGGAVTVGAGAGALGLVTGSAAGAACGAVPALLTFGLSIPVGAALGGGAGACFGAATGGAAGLLGGGAAGYGLYARRQDIGSGASCAWQKVHTVAESVKERANSSASYVKARLCGTGGTQ